MFIKNVQILSSSHVVIQYLVSPESCGLHYYLIIMKTSQQVKIFIFFYQLAGGLFSRNIPVDVSSLGALCTMQINTRLNYLVELVFIVHSTNIYLYNCALGKFHTAINKVKYNC